MAREYIIPAAAITLANQAVSVIFVNPGTTLSLEILRAYASQAANATSAQQRVQLSTQVTAFPTLVSQAPVVLKQRDPVSAITGGIAGAAGTSGINASAEGAGAKTVIIPDSFNVLNGWLWVPTPRETMVMAASAAAGLGLVFPVAPATLTSWSAGLVFAELG